MAGALHADFFRSLWGPSNEMGDFAALCADTVARGYCGVEFNPLFWGDTHGERKQILDDHGLRFLVRAHTFGQHVAGHVEWVKRCVDLSLESGSPHVIVQSGGDHFTDAEVDEFFAATAAIEAESGVRLAHETHRGCILYSPWIARRVLERWPDLWLASDYSHWVIVAERHFAFEDELFARFATRTLHIDARVGTPESPQVADPRTEDAAEALGWFDRYWDEIHAAALARDERLTVVPEFGPPPYEPPGAGDRDDICQWMVDHLRDRWST